MSRHLACVTSVSVWFRSRERSRNGILDFGRREMKQEPKTESALLLTPFFARSLTLVPPRSLLLNRTETLATQPTRHLTRFTEGNGIACVASVPVGKTLVPCSLLRSRTEALATRARSNAK